MKLPEAEIERLAKIGMTTSISAYAKRVNYYLGPHHSWEAQGPDVREYWRATVRAIVASIPGSMCALVVRGYLELHRLDKQGKNESPEAEAIREALDAPQRQLTAYELGVIQRLLDDLAEAPVGHEAISPPSDVAR